MPSDEVARRRKALLARKRRLAPKGNSLKWNSNISYDEEEKRRLDRTNKRLQFVYGIDLDDHEAMLREQRGVCAICEDDPETGLVVDHCHTSGKVRGLLCHSCNIMLGLAKDNINTLLSAIKYLEKVNNAL